MLRIISDLSLMMLSLIYPKEKVKEKATLFQIIYSSF